MASGSPTRISPGVKHDVDGSEAGREMQQRLYWNNGVRQSVQLDFEQTAGSGQARINRKTCFRSGIRSSTPDAEPTAWILRSLRIPEFLSVWSCVSRTEDFVRQLGHSEQPAVRSQLRIWKRPWRPGRSTGIYFLGYSSATDVSRISEHPWGWYRKRNHVATPVDFRSHAQGRDAESRWSQGRIRSW